MSTKTLSSSVPSVDAETTASTISMQEPASTRLPQLDFLRGVAILLVLGAHQGMWHFKQGGACKIFADILYRVGYSGVDLFFVLSGFLIGGLIIREIATSGEFDVARFAVRRIFKIWPLYYVYLAVVAVMLAFEKSPAGFGHYLRTIILPAVVNIQNMTPSFFHDKDHIFPPIVQTWSLAVEEHFYFALPLVVLFALKKCKSAGDALRVVAGVCIASLLVCNILRVALNWNRPYVTFTHVMPTYLRIDGLALGVLLAYAYHVRTDIWSALGRPRVALAGAGALLLLPLAAFNHDKIPWMRTVGFTTNYLGYACLLVVLMHTRPRVGVLGRFVASPAGRCIEAIGQYSYSIYLWQMLFAAEFLDHFWFLIKRAPEGNARYLAMFASTVLVSIVCGAAVSRLLEYPTLAIRDRFFPGRSIAVKTG